MRGRSLRVLVGVAATILVAAGVPAAASAQSRQFYEAQLTSELPGTSTGFSQTINYVNPEDPDGKPYAVEEIVLRLPQGSRIDTSVPPQCGATDPEFQLEGEDACPPETEVGEGSLNVDFGAAVGPLPRVVENAGTFFNNQDELILFTESTNTGEPPIRTANRFEVGANTFTSTVPPLPAVPPPDPFAAIKDVSNRIEAVSGGTGNYITTPSSCPPSGQWTISATFTYRDGTVQTEQSSTPCRATPSAPTTDEGGSGGAEGSAGRGADRFPRGGVEAGGGQAPVGSDGVALTPLGAGLVLVGLAGSGIVALLRRT